MDSTPLPSHDNHGKVYIQEDRVIRKIDSSYWDQAKAMYQQFHTLGLQKLGIIETSLGDEPATFFHPKYRISYSYEWPANMYKSALILQLELLLKLGPHKITLKDAIPENILFDATTPVFVDFLSLIPMDALSQETWLKIRNIEIDHRFAVVEPMLIPHWLIPWVGFVYKNYALARELLQKHACNSGQPSPNWKHFLFSLSGQHDSLGRQFKELAKWSLRLPKQFRRAITIRNFLSQYAKAKNPNYILYLEKVLDWVKGQDVTPMKSPYLFYYDEKDESFSLQAIEKWHDKQKNVAKILAEHEPSSVLDIGANTGWFTKLACQYAPEVLATDMDESCMDHLYHYAKQKDMNILPLVVGFDALEKDVNSPIFRPIAQRLRSHTVLCLGLLHHLTLGMGKPVANVMRTLAELTEHVLVLEFVDWPDEKIRKEPSFFPHLRQFSSQNYSLDQVIHIGQSYFPKVQILESHPKTRSLLVFTK